MYTLFIFHPFFTEASTLEFSFYSATASKFMLQFSSYFLSCSYSMIFVPMNSFIKSINKTCFFIKKYVVKSYQLRHINKTA